MMHILRRSMAAAAKTMVALLVFPSIHAQGAFQTVFSADFQTSVPGEFSNGSLSASGIGAEAVNQGLSQYLGRFTLSDSTTLTVTGLPSHNILRLEFDLYLFETWDGSSGSGPDFVSLSGDTTFQETFTNHQGPASNPNQTYDALGDVFLNSNGTALSSYGDTSAIQSFFDLGPTGNDSYFEFAHDTSSFSVTFGGPTSQSDESWGIDNVRVSLIPEPSHFVSVGLGAVFLATAVSRNRRRNQSSTQPCVSG